MAAPGVLYSGFFLILEVCIFFKKFSGNGNGEWGIGNGEFCF